jgi:mRNA interferase HigB
MKLLGKKLLDDFARLHADVRSQIDAWIAEVEEATWQGPMDIKARFRSASFLADNRVVFNLKGNRYRLDTKVNYKNQIVLVMRIGTHAQYDTWTF